jgi:hypothetical protein
MDTNQSNVLEYNPKATDEQPVAIFQRTEEAWENDTERVVVFAVTRPLVDADWQRELRAGNVIEVIDPNSQQLITNYTMPARPNAGFALQYMDLATQLTVDQVFAWIIKTACGPEALHALAREVSGAGEQGPALIRSIAGKCQRIAAGLERSGKD